MKSTGIDGNGRTVEHTYSNPILHIGGKGLKSAARQVIRSIRMIFMGM
jgi:hypothetical protein